MTITQRFDAELLKITDSLSLPPNIFPELLTDLVAQLLNVEGASLSLLSDELRMPLGASSTEARAAELIQFTQGDGPCIDTYRSGIPIALGREDLAVRWPKYLAAMELGTTYRSVISVPLKVGGKTIGALDCYLTDPARPARTALADAVAVVVPLGEALLRASDAIVGGRDGDLTDLDRLDNEQMHRRAMNWIAIGAVGRAADLSSLQALELLRAYAGQVEHTLDDVAYDIASHNVVADDVIALVRRAQ